jgi:hypothetical protein
MSNTKSIWGPAVWTMFHTLAHKVVPEEFEGIKVELIQYIYRICANLPCPECAQHAQDYLNKNSKRIIATKEDLKRFLIDFHNNANAITKKPHFSYEDAEARYELAKTAAVVHYFFQIYGKKSNGNLKLMTNRFHKDILLSEFSAWMLRNSGKFVG